MTEAKKSNITFVLFSFNEEKRIEYAVRNLIPYGEVLILDDGSTDRTKEIAEGLGAKLLRRPASSLNYTETQAMLDFAKSHISTQWIYWSYVDNLLPKALLDKMSEISRQDKIKIVHVPIFTYLWGETKTEVIRAAYANFFNKDYIDFSENRMHGLGKFLGKPDEILKLPWKKEYAIRHFSLYDLNKFVSAHLNYAQKEAEEKHKEGKKFSLFYMLGSPAKYFWLFYKRGWRLGIKGLYIALLYSSFRLMVAVKLYELENNLTLETIEESFAKEKKKLVEEAEAF
jgi:glycosyltransferase involved in cell wall biosynthesis